MKMKRVCFIHLFVFCGRIYGMVTSGKRFVEYQNETTSQRSSRASSKETNTAHPTSIRKRQIPREEFTDCSIGRKLTKRNRPGFSLTLSNCKNKVNNECRKFDFPQNFKPNEDLLRCWYDVESRKLFIFNLDDYYDPTLHARLYEVELSQKRRHWIELYLKDK